MGAGQEQDRGRSLEAAVQGGLNVPAVRHPAAARRQVEDSQGERGLCRHRAAAVLDRGHATPNHMTTSEQLGRAMIKVARDGYQNPIVESEDINAV